MIDAKRRWNDAKRRWNDGINCGFESCGGLFIALHIAKLLQDKSVAGVDWRSVAFFSAWGIWNLVYYSNLKQPWSVAASAMTAVANVVWLILLLRYQ